MCESIAYLHTDGNEDELLLEDVVMLRPEKDSIILINIMGDKKEVKAAIDHIDLVKHRIVLRPKI